MSAYSKSVKFLFDLEVFGMKFGLHGIRTLLAAIGNPQKDFKSIHVAGTNGKGSTSSMLAAIFTAAGYRTGLYTSPHLVSFTERIRINGKAISRSDVARLTNLIRRQVRKQQATYFEAVTAIAFKYFSEQNVDIAIIETGLGGRLDATNVVRPLVSVITNISLEHTAILGKTLESIAREKAGIIKHSVPCVTGIEESKPLAVVRRQARKRNAQLFRSLSVNVRVLHSSLYGLEVDARSGHAHYRRLRLSLAGDHQTMNLRVALRTIGVVQKLGLYTIAEDHIRRGLANIEALSGLRGRLSVFQRYPLVLGDVAHNPDSTHRLVDALKKVGVRNVFLVFGVVQDKDYHQMVRFLGPITRAAIVTEARTTRARRAADLSAEFTNQGIPVVEATKSVRRAVALALKRSMKNVPVLITGSHYVLGEAIPILRSRKFT